MLDVLQFIFRDFQTWLGTVVLISVLGATIGAVRK